MSGVSTSTSKHQHQLASLLGLPAAAAVLQCGGIEMIHDRAVALCASTSTSGSTSVDSSLFWGRIILHAVTKWAGAVVVMRTASSMVAWKMLGVLILRHLR